MGCFQSKQSKSAEDTIGHHKRAKSAAESVYSKADESALDRKREKHRSTIADPRLLSVGNHEIEAGTLVQKNLTMQEKSAILKSLSSHFLFNTMSKESVHGLIKEFKLYSFGPRKQVFSEGSEGQNFYIIHSGTVEVLVEGVRKALINKGGFFGEMALLHNSKRTATIRTIDKSMFWVLSREGFKAAIQTVSEAKQQENRNFIEKIPLFSRFTAAQKDSLLNLLVLHEFQSGQRIVREKENGDLLYIIKRGYVMVSVEGIQKRKLGPGDFFGEQALLYKTKRTASVDAIDKVALLSLKADDLVDLLGSKLESVIFKNSLRISFEKSQILSKLNKEQNEAFVENVEIFNFALGKNVIKKGVSKNSVLVIVLKGEISAKGEVRGNFDILGDNEIYEDDDGVYTHRWITTCDSTIGLISKDQIEELLKGSLKRTIFQNELILVMKKVQLLRTLPDSILESLISCLKIQTFSPDQIIFSQGDEADAFYIIESGQVEVLINDQLIRQITTHDFFGERGILFNESRTATVISKGVTCWILTKKDFLKLVANSKRKQILKRIDLQDDKVSMEDLTLVKQLGKGMFGVVLLAHNYNKKISYALKSVHRSSIEEFKISENLLLERKILMLIDHPFIVKLVKTFKDQQRVYFLMELVQGMDLFDVIRQFPVMDEDKSMFYMACLVLIIEHLHERNIIYRDLKPENIMVDDEGYAKLIDFGTAKIIKGKTNTVVGTPQYMAPEILKASGYSLEADLWSLGIILYEFICNSVPFGEGEEDPFKIYNLILQSKLSFPAFAQNFACKPLIEKLLNPNPALRGNFESLKKHSWFSRYNWDDLLNKQIEPPFKPPVQNLKKEIEKGKSSENFDAAISKFEGMSKEYNAKGKLNNWDSEF